MAPSAFPVTPPFTLQEIEDETYWAEPPRTEAEARHP
ncbi:hypothetical protein [Beijerinckia sp. L45]